MLIPAHYHEPLLTPNAARSVEAAWTFVATTKGRALVLPDGRCDVIVRFNAHSDAAPVPVLTGPATQPYEVSFEAGDTWIGVRMRPGSGVAFWGDRLWQMADHAARGSDAIAALPELAAVIDMAPHTDALGRALLDLPAVAQAAPCGETLQAALDAQHLTGGRLAMASLARLSGCTTRHMGRLFQRAVGLSPKTYAQLVRFHRAVALLTDGHLTLTQTALEAGYADQAHMSRDVLRFGGFHPSALPAHLSQPGFFA